MKPYTTTARGIELPAVKSIAQALKLKVTVRKSFLLDRYSVTFWGSPETIAYLSKVRSGM